MWLLFAAVATVEADEYLAGHWRARGNRGWRAIAVARRSGIGPNLIGGGSTSLIDNPDFFLAANGKSGPAKELDQPCGVF